jgi:hypothetical protein
MMPMMPGWGAPQQFDNNSNYPQPPANWPGYALPSPFFQAPWLCWPGQSAPGPSQPVENKSIPRGKAKDKTPRHRSGSESGELVSSEDEYGKDDFKTLAKKLDLDVEYVDYRSKIELASDLLYYKPVEDDDERGLETGKSKDDKVPMEFPFTEVLQKHFERAWLGATGEEDLDAEGDRDMLTPPIMGVKDGKRSWPKKAPKMKFYRVRSKSNPGWPLDKVQVDPNLKDAVQGSSSGPKPVDDWMDMVGRSLKVLNQMVFFNEATAKMMKKLGQVLPPELLEKWKSFKEFVHIQNQSLEDLMSINTNLMINLLLDKRAACVQNAKVSKDIKSALKFISPIDTKSRLFSGKLNDFDKDRKDITSARLSEEVISSLRNKRKNVWSSPNDQKKQRGDGKEDNSQYGKRRSNNAFYNRRKGADKDQKSGSKDSFPGSKSGGNNYNNNNAGGNNNNNSNKKF